MSRGIVGVEVFECKAVKINHLWWEHLAPKQLISRHREIEKLLTKFIQSEYGQEWFKLAENPHGVFRLKPGQEIPVVKLIFLGNQAGYIGPFEKVRIGHRAVVSATSYLSGKDIDDSELVVVPTILVDLAEGVEADTTNPQKLIIQFSQPSLVFSTPAHFLLSPKHYPKKSYVLYQHIFGNIGTYPHDGYFYVGVTTRSWQKRWSEHKRSIETGSPLLFHRKFREESQLGRLTYVHHKVMGITDDLEQLYKAEEFLVEGHWRDERRLNMIPGGKSGLRYLRENGFLEKNFVPEPDNRIKILKNWLITHPEQQLPAPWLSEKWQDNDWAIAQICSRNDRLSIEQVRAIRSLAEAHSIDEIAFRIGARNTDQVKGVLDGKTYTRVDQ